MNITMHPLALAVLAALGTATQPASGQPAGPAKGQTQAPPQAAQPAAEQTAPEAATLPEVRVEGFRGEQVSGVKYPRPLLETPRIITVLPEALLQEQGATSLKDALRNIPGISLQAGEGNPPGGDQLKIRGFNARDDINVNGTRDLGNYFRDPFYVDQLEVIKGPNSAYSGRGSAGGTINFVTKLPQRRDFARAELGAGTDSFFRGTLDINKVIDDNSAVRVNLMGHDADIPGRDLAEESRYGLYAAYTWGFASPTRITADLLYTRQDDRPDHGLPLDRTNLLGTGGRLPPGIDFSNFYGHTGDYKKVDVTQLGLALQHAFGGGPTLRNQTRYSVVKNDSVGSSPRFTTGSIAGQPNDGITTSCSVAAPCARGETKPRDQEDVGINNQTDLIFRFDTGAVRHDLVAGVELARYTYENQRRRDTRGPWTSLYDPTVRAIGPFQVIGGTLYGEPRYDGTVYRLETDEVGVYLLDTMRLSAQWDLNLGVRWDRVKAEATRRGFDGTNAPASNNTTHEREDDEVSYSLGLVYKPTPSSALYAAFGNAYVMSANFDRNNVQLAGGAAAEAIVGAGFNTPPEQIRAYELGYKQRVGAGLDLAAAVFRTETSEGRFPAQVAGALATPNASYYINGFELLAAGRVTRDWQLYAGYTFLRSKVTASPASGANEPFVVGQELGGTPRHTFTAFTIYDLTAAISIGGGVQYVSSQTSGVQPQPGPPLKVTIDSYSVLDLYAAYRFTPKTQLRFNAFNVTDRKYISQLAEGGSQGIPGRGRQLVATLRHDF